MEGYKLDKYIFLDVDGVLNCENSYKRIPRHSPHLEDGMISLLKQLVTVTGAKIVLSSSWRLSARSMDDLLNKFDEFGLNLYGVTPDSFGCRAQEIMRWMECHSLHKDNCAFVILDDETIEEPLRSHQVKTSWYGKDGGLQHKHVNECLTLFESQILR